MGVSLTPPTFPVKKNMPKGGIAWWTSECQGADGWRGLRYDTHVDGSAAVNMEGEQDFSPSRSVE